jgi:proteasome component ECM29
MTGPLAQVLQHGGRQVVSTGYDELRAFFTRVDQWIVLPEASGEQLAAPLTGLAEKILTGEVDGSVEAIRKGRAEAILAYLRLSPHAQGVPDTLLMRVRAWRASERSEPVQRLLDEALAFPN